MKYKVFFHNPVDTPSLETDDLEEAIKTAEEHRTAGGNGTITTHDDDGVRMIYESAAEIFSY